MLDSISGQEKVADETQQELMMLGKRLTDLEGMLMVLRAGLASGREEDFDSRKEVEQQLAAIISRLNNIERRQEKAEEQRQALQSFQELLAELRHDLNHGRAEQAKIAGQVDALQQIIEQETSRQEQSSLSARQSLEQHVTGWQNELGSLSGKFEELAAGFRNTADQNEVELTAVKQSITNLTAGGQQTEDRLALLEEKLTIGLDKLNQDVEARVASGQQTEDRLTQLEEKLTIGLDNLHQVVEERVNGALDGFREFQIEVNTRQEEIWATLTGSMAQIENFSEKLATALEVQGLETERIDTAIKDLGLLTENRLSAMDQRLGADQNEYLTQINTIQQGMREMAAVMETNWTEIASQRLDLSREIAVTTQETGVEQSAYREQINRLEDRINDQVAKLADLTAGLTAIETSLPERGTVSDRPDQEDFNRRFDEIGQMVLMLSSRMAANMEEVQEQIRELRTAINLGSGEQQNNDVKDKLTNLEEALRELKQELTRRDENLNGKVSRLEHLTELSHEISGLWDKMAIIEKAVDQSNQKVQVPSSTGQLTGGEEFTRRLDDIGQMLIVLSSRMTSNAEELESRLQEVTGQAETGNRDVREWTQGLLAQFEEKMAQFEQHLGQTKGVNFQAAMNDLSTMFYTLRNEWNRERSSLDEVHQQIQEMNGRFQRQEQIFQEARNVMTSYRAELSSNRKEISDLKNGLAQIEADNKSKRGIFGRK